MVWEFALISTKPSSDQLTKLKSKCHRSCILSLFLIHIMDFEDWTGRPLIFPECVLFLNFPNFDLKIDLSFMHHVCSVSLHLFNCWNIQSFKSDLPLKISFDLIIMVSTLGSVILPATCWHYDDVCWILYWINDNSKRWLNSSHSFK